MDDCLFVTSNSGSANALADPDPADATTRSDTGSSHERAHGGTIGRANNCSHESAYHGSYHGCDDGTYYRFQHSIGHSRCRC